MVSTTLPSFTIVMTSSSSEAPSVHSLIIGSWKHGREQASRSGAKVGDFRHRNFAMHERLICSKCSLIQKDERSHAETKAFGRAIAAIVRG
jgi:hypothetical protein